MIGHVAITEANGMLGRSVCNKLHEQTFLVTAIVHTKSLLHSNYAKWITLDLSLNFCAGAVAQER